MRRGAAVLMVALVLAPIATAGTMEMSRIDEQIVEGHTVFVRLQKLRMEAGWDIVGFAREFSRGPNLLWFNDQWKVFDDRVRYPCGGFILATWANVDPLAYFGQAAAGVNGVTQPLGLTYVESYHITDPNGAGWDTDLYALTGVYARLVPVWITSILNAQVPDDGVSQCGALVDLAPHPAFGSNGVPYYDNVDNLPVRRYNFEIFGLWRDVFPEIFGGKEHGEGGRDNTDGTGCDSFTEWSCDAPENSLADDFEGNSHPYNPDEADAGPIHEHETARIDVFFLSDWGPFQSGLFQALGGYPPNPRNYAIYETEAVESDVKPCDPNDPFSNINGGSHAHC